MCGYILSAQTVRTKVKHWTFEDIQAELTQLVQGWDKVGNTYQNLTIADIDLRFSASYTQWRNLHEFVLNYTSVVAATIAPHVAINAEMWAYMEIWGEMLKDLRFGM